MYKFLSGTKLIIPLFSVTSKRNFLKILIFLFLLILNGYYIKNIIQMKHFLAFNVKEKDIKNLACVTERLA